MDQSLKGKLLVLQKGEITDHLIYSKLAKKQNNETNRNILQKIAKDELDHYKFWMNVTNKKVKPNKIKVWFFFFISRIFGLTFGIRLMEKGEEKTQHLYEELIGQIDGLQKLIDDEEEHEQALIDTLDEERLMYIGSIVLGLNDALVELTGTLAGLTFALANAKVVGLAGLITGIAASLSMASSEYLSTKQEGSHKYALKSAFYTGSAYVFAVIFMILPYLLMPTTDIQLFGVAVESVFISLTITIVIVVFIIFTFNYYISIAKNLNFKKRFLEMITISLGVALLSFFIGYLVRIFFGIDV